MFGRSNVVDTTKLNVVTNATTIAVVKKVSVPTERRFMSSSI